MFSASLVLLQSYQNIFFTAVVVIISEDDVSDKLMKLRAKVVVLLQNIDKSMFIPEVTTNDIFGFIASSVNTLY